MTTARAKASKSLHYAVQTEFKCGYRPTLIF